MGNHKWADVAHYYTDIPCLETITKQEFQAAFFLPKTHRQLPFNAAWYGKEINFSNTYTPILRALEDMTEVDTRELYLHWSGIEYHGHYEAIHFFKEKHVYTREDSTLKELIGHPQAWSWLISKGFDVFNLIESGQAIRKGVENG